MLISLSSSTKSTLIAINYIPIRRCLLGLLFDVDVARCLLGLLFLLSALLLSGTRTRVHKDTINEIRFCVRIYESKIARHLKQHSPHYALSRRSRRVLYYITTERNYSEITERSENSLAHTKQHTKQRTKVYL